MIPDVVYQAPWTLNNECLQRGVWDICGSSRGLVQKVIDCALAVLSRCGEMVLLPLQRLFAYWFVGPLRAEPGYLEQVEREWQAAHRGHQVVRLTTPDGVQLPPAPWYRFADREDAPTVMVLSPFIPAVSHEDKEENTRPSVAMSPECDWMVEEARARRCNLLLIDVRRDTQRFADQLLDAASGCEFLRSKGVKKISIFGYCAGGVVAAKVAALYQARAVVYNAFTDFRTFFCHSSYMRASMEKRAFCVDLIQWGIASAASLVGWAPTIDATEVPDALQHAEDELVPAEARLPNAVLLRQKTDVLLPPHRGHWSHLRDCTGPDGREGHTIAFDLLGVL